jgi:hypothetical protein
VEILENPLLLTLFLLLSAVSFVFLVAGVKSRNGPWVLYGIGAAIPTFAIRSPLAWLAGVVVAGMGWALARWASP